MKWGVRFLILAAIVALWSAAPARASNFFCDGSASVVPWNVGADVPLYSGVSADYGLTLWVKGKRDAAARVTLITDREAYSVNVPRLPLHAEDGESDEASVPFLVRFPTAQHVLYAFVDGIGIDGADVSDCPSVVTDVKPNRDADAGTYHLGSLPFTLHPVLLQSLPALPCGSVYIEPRVVHMLELTAGLFGNAERHALVRVYVDSNGTIVHTKIVSSSGVEGIDALAMAAVQGSTYQPARFLCVPVVSEFEIDMKYASY